ncbi:MAG: UvrD-helicase domain-containing protein [Phycisphaerales bacterium]|nr:UvrD-helicase domain-containing protein [Phycisphaerales bacterium]
MVEAGMQLLEGLTEAQLEAVTTLEGPLLVLAGPGSGKTMVVTRRVAHLVAEGTDPARILALTFTNKAAAQMRERVSALVGDTVTAGMQVSTFHAFCARQLRIWSDAAGVSPNYSIWDTTDQRDAAKQAVADAGMSTSNWPPASVLSTISAAKNRLVDAATFEQEATDFNDRMVAKVYNRYEAILRRNDALDFDDLLRLVARMLLDNPSVSASFQQRWQYILVDEYQDTNHAQFIIASSLAQSHRNICVVGDPDQSIYRWRGADIRNILDFEEHYPEARVVPLGRNFRSTGHIVSAAAGLISCNTSHRHKDLHTQLDDGAPITIRTCLDEHEEAEAIVNHFRAAAAQGRPWKEMAVLYRINSLSRVLEDAFRRADIPHVVARGTAFYERREIKDALAYLRLLLNPNDDIALRRIINVPTRGIGKTTLDRVAAHATATGCRLGEAIRQPSGVPELTDRARKALSRFTEMVDGWREAMTSSLLGLDLADVVSMVLRDSGLEAAMVNTDDGEDRVENLSELVSAAADRPIEPDEEGNLPDLDRQLAHWLESIALVSDSDAIDPESGAVTLMTLHAAKGLEFDVVAVAALEQGVLPHSRSAMDPESLEEERRLCYVGMTRARLDLLMTRAMMRTHRGLRDRTMSSPFLDEIPAAHAQVVMPVEPWQNTASSTPRGPTLFKVGDQVEHPRFGLGRIQRVMARPRGTTATIDFDEYGPRTLLVAQAGLERVGAEYDDTGA